MAESYYYRGSDLFYRVYKGTSFNDNEDKCIIGYIKRVNYNEKVLEDAVTGQRVECKDCSPVYNLGCRLLDKNHRETDAYMILTDGGRRIDLTLGYITAFRVMKIEELARQKILNESDIFYMKQIIGKTLVENHRLDEKEMANKNTAQSEIDKDMIANEREF